MQVLSAQAVSELEKSAIKQGLSASDFMEKAGYGIALAIKEFILKHPLINHIVLLCGKGNNGGDAYVAGCYLLNYGYSVSAIQLESLENCSELCKKNALRFENLGGTISQQIQFDSNQLLIDGLFGTGFKGKIQEPYIKLIEKANQSHVPILSIDIPSGLNGSTGEINGLAIRANETLCLGFPKTGFFLQQGWNVVGQLKFVDFGLPPNIFSKENASFVLLTKSFIKNLLPKLVRNRHKYQAGYVMGLAGSRSMPGAALLPSLAALRAGSGMVHLLYPEDMRCELNNSPYELIKTPYALGDTQKVLQELQKAKAIFVGPGLGLTQPIDHLLRSCLPHLNASCVLDADALTLYTKTPFLLPKRTIFTPHTGEMQKLLQETSHLILNENILKKCQQYAEQRDITLILKGAPTFIFHPNQPIYVNPTGNCGMATAGSGDVLTGIIASFLSQGLESHQAALLGVFLHGLAGDIAKSKRLTERGMIASDLIDHLNLAYHALEQSV
ncbi:bifunctional ADP-dependent NAD(P)H-hydrate dehydratase/NAD(P)H-hydrate epimerase [Candidatus Protochlamydia sp. W-9]|uniref:bifunctional ADP-dependent NAD(P)H-hydrate dehydratase/NAD(P)H-hydrate epimerase n=1 Tax=Candidatus Protochlamydia sp. W-9 TaxID=1785087 RepID=UPI00096A435A|nr:bifunctional ADP-dependent NAD(P)H-hydrate dehydratase/NAD(P)H-hydrate epimerase [Candidatus Protochlamydia sp. W-9]